MDTTLNYVEVVVTSPVDQTTEPTTKAVHAIAVATKPTVPTVPQVTAVATTKPKLAPEAQYAYHIMADKFVASQDSLFYCWNGNFWKLQSDTENARHAFMWLAKNIPNRATGAASEACVKTAALMANPLPPKPNKTIVPVNGVWLQFNSDHTITVAKPNFRVGITHRVPAKCTSNATSGEYIPGPVPDDSLFGKFLKSSLPNEAVRKLVQSYVGYTLSSDASYQCAQLWIGPRGSNGKSTMLKIVRALHEKAVSIQLDKLDGFSLSSLIGATLVACDEAAQKKINQQAIKSLISGGATAVDRKYRDPLTYQPSAKWIVCSNHHIVISDNSDAWWRRWQIIEWNETFKGDQIIPNLDEQIIQKELHIVLDWALAGLQNLEKSGKFIIPEAVTDSIKNAKIETNSVANWIENNGVSETENVAFTSKSTLFVNYQEFCKENGFQACALNQFYQRVHAHFPDLREIRGTSGNGTGKKRARSVNLTTGVFKPEDHKEQANIELEKAVIEQAEIETAFG